jgi:Gpi18-like mannosyltransferase
MPERYPQTMIFLLVASAVIGAWFLVRISLKYGQNPYSALIFLLIPGFTCSLYYGLPESICAAFLLAGVSFYLERRMAPAALFFAASLLVRNQVHPHLDSIGMGVLP